MIKIHLRSLEDENRPLCDDTSYASCDLQLTLAAAEMVAAGTPGSRVCGSCRVAYFLHTPEVEAEEPTFTSEQADAVLDACARASWEANVAADIATGSKTAASWLHLDEKMKESWKRQTAICMDEVVDGAEKTAEESIESFASKTSKTGFELSRANLTLSVVAAMLNVLGQELK